MTEERRETLLKRLVRKLRIEALDGETAVRLLEELEDAESELQLYLACSPLPEVMWGKVVELAAIYAKRDGAESDGLKSSSYSEGNTSQSLSYMTEGEYQTAISELLRSIAHYRRRAT